MASGTWTSVATSGAWNTTTNWSGGTVASGAGFTATFSSNITATTAIDTTTGVNWIGTIGNLTLSDSGANGSTWTLGSQATTTLDVASGSSTITTTTSATIAGILAGNDPVIKDGAQTLTLQGANTLSGGLTVSNGTLSATTTTTALGAATGSRAFTVSTGGTLSMGFAGQNYSNATLNLSGTGVSNGGALIIANTGITTFSSITLVADALIRATSAGTLAAAGGIATDTGKNLTLAGSAAALTVSAPVTGVGNLTIGISGSTASITLSGVNTYSGSTTLAFASLTVTGTLGGGTYAGNISIASGMTFDYNSSSNQTLSGIISGAGNLRRFQAGGGVLTVTGANTYTGLTTVTFSTLSFNSIENVGSTTASALGKPTTITLGTIAFGTLTLSATLLYTGTGHSTDRVINLAGTTGGATITANGTGALSFTNIAGFTATGTGIKTFQLSGTNTGENIFTPVITNAAGSTAVNFSKTGAGTWTLSSANTFTGTATASAGTIRAGNNQAFGLGALSVGGVTVTSADSTARSIVNALTFTGATVFGATSTYTGAFSFVGASTFGSSTRTITTLVPVTLSGVLTGTSSAGLTKEGAETLTLSSANTYPGPTTINAGVIFAKNVTALGTGAVTIGTGCTLQSGTGDGQNGKLTIGTTLTNTAGGTIKIGYSITILAANAFIYAPTTDFSSTLYSISLDPAVITGVGSYAIIYSPVALTNYVGGTATFSTPPAWAYSSITVTPSGAGSFINISGTVYYAVVVTIA